MKTRTRVLSLLLALVMLFSAMPVLASSEYDEPAADETAVIGENNELLVPFDQAYSEEFSSGVNEYEKDTFLVKLTGEVEDVPAGLAAAGVAELELLFTLQDAVWYTAHLIEGAAVEIAVETARTLPDVLVAEYNFIAKTSAEGFYDSSINLSQWQQGGYNEKLSEQWYLQSSGIKGAWDFLEAKGGKAGGSANVVVAVIDTGVDYLHEDLRSNMWVNTGEIPDDGIDNDGNGYVDDYYGVDMVAKQGNGNDDNGHGTHVAGIIAAANNKVGILGVAYNAKIMSVKAGMSSGYFSQSDIAEAVMYAFDMGADVINMSFGGGASTLAVQDALAVAYSRCVLVAAAGNEGNPNEATKYYDPMPCYPAALTYVLGVMSVDPNGVESGFTNWDVYGYNGVEYELYAPGSAMISTIPGNRYATWSGTSMAAPIVSGIAALLRSYYSDRDAYPTRFIYGQLASTSEWSAICNNLDDHATLGGTLHDIPPIVDAEAALTKIPSPELGIADFTIFDDPALSSNNNGDGVIDAGERIALGFTISNRWGMSSDTTVMVDTKTIGDLEDPYITIENDTVNYGSIGTYSTGDAGKVMDGDRWVGWQTPIYLNISKDCPNDYIATLNISLVCRNGLNEADETIYRFEDIAVNLTVRKGIIISGAITQDTTWTRDNYYIIANATTVAKGVTLTVQPGTQIQFWSNDPEDPYAEKPIVYLRAEGTINFKGTAAEPVVIKPSERMSQYRVQIYQFNGGTVNMEYVHVTNAHLNRTASPYGGFLGEGITYAKGCHFTKDCPGYLYYRELFNGVPRDDAWGAGGLYIQKAEQCSTYNLDGGAGYRYYLAGNYTDCLFADSCIEPCGSTTTFTRCVFYGNSNINNGVYDNVSSLGLYYNGSVGANNVLALHYREETETTYVRLAYGYQTSGEQIQQLAAALGGALACFETEEEYTYVCGLDVTGYVNLPAEAGTTPFVEGCAVGLTVSNDGQVAWATTNEVSYLPNVDLSNLIMSTPYMFLCADGNFYCYTGSNLYHSMLIEIPDSDGSLTKDEITERLAEARANGLFAHFTGNAILNRLADGNVEKWLRLTTGAADTYTVIDAQGNYFGTDNAVLIGKQILDYEDYQTQCKIDTGAILSDAPSNIWPFVESVTLSQGGQSVTTVGGGDVTFTLTFNRDMEMSVPVEVHFGSAYPFNDYTVEGGYVNPRTWVGTYTLTSVIASGQMYMNISGAASDEQVSRTIPWDRGRFAFVVDNTAALAMTLQGHATDTSIELEWFQDDFDTLAGYNIYRATEENGQYQRLNATILGPDEKTFSDTTVEPGQIYYYNFTVVKTDMTESAPSGKTRVQAKDTMAPNIYHSPVYTAFTGSNLMISATVMDNVSIQRADLFYRVKGQTEWKSVTMDHHNDKYSAAILADYITLVGLEYYIRAFDGISYTYNGTADEPHSVTVQQGVDEKQMGDVDMDGSITLRDALLVLQAACGLVNLEATPFARADVTGNGQVQANDALRILQYVNGKITTLTSGQ